MRKILAGAVAGACVFAAAPAAVAAPAGDVRLTHDANDPGYVSSYTIGSAQPYTDATLDECTRARGRQNEPAVGVDPRDPRVVSAAPTTTAASTTRPAPTASRSPPARSGWAITARRTAADSFTSSLVPGYPGDTSPYAKLAQIRTASRAIR